MVEVGAPLADTMVASQRSGVSMPLAFQVGSLTTHRPPPYCTMPFTFFTVSFADEAMDESSNATCTRVASLSLTALRAWRYKLLRRTRYRNAFKGPSLGCDPILDSCRRDWLCDGVAACLALLALGLRPRSAAWDHVGECDRGLLRADTEGGLAYSARVGGRVARYLCSSSHSLLRLQSATYCNGTTHWQRQGIAKQSRQC